MASFDSAEAAPLFKTGVCALLSVPYERRDHIPVTVYLEETALLRLPASFRTHPLFELRIIAFEKGSLFFLKRGSALTYDAAGAAALLIIAAEILRNNLGRDKNVPYFYD